MWWCSCNLKMFVWSGGKSYEDLVTFSERSLIEDLAWCWRCLYGRDITNTTTPNLSKAPCNDKSSLIAVPPGKGQPWSTQKDRTSWWHVHGKAHLRKGTGTTLCCCRRRKFRLRSGCLLQTKKLHVWISPGRWNFACCEALPNSLYRMFAKGDLALIRVWAKSIARPETLDGFCFCTGKLKPSGPLVVRPYLATWCSTHTLV